MMWLGTWPSSIEHCSPMPRFESGCRVRRVLFIQATEPAGYPPLIHASSLMAEAGWKVTVLSAPIKGKRLELPRHPGIALRAIPARPSHVMSKAAYARYIAAAARLALCLRPAVVYASDPLGAGPGLLAARLAGARLVYHEHDSPAPGSLRRLVARARAAAGRLAELIIFPNEARARIAQAELGFSADRLRIIWNMPRRAELPALDIQPEAPLMIYYHGGLSPDLLPIAVVEAVRRLCGRARLQIVGREAPGAVGYVQRLLDLGGGGNSAGFIHYAGQVSRAQLATTARQSHVGLALMTGSDLNIRHLTGASNKVFDYMAARLALLIPDHADWRDMFVTPGYGRACDPTDPASIAAALTWFLDHPAERRAMGSSGRARIEADWNYDSAFAPVICALSRRRER
jgi:glycosyltransferase involved in cell wall biosynthesis